MNAWRLVDIPMRPADVGFRKQMGERGVDQFLIQINFISLMRY
jgi:hypothetical protein